MSDLSSGTINDPYRGIPNTTEHTCRARSEFRILNKWLCEGEMNQYPDWRFLNAYPGAELKTIRKDNFEDFLLQPQWE